MRPTFLKDFIRLSWGRRGGGGDIAPAVAGHAPHGRDAGIAHAKVAKDGKVVPRLRNALRVDV